MTAGMIMNKRKMVLVLMIWQPTPPLKGRYWSKNDTNACVFTNWLVSYREAAQFPGRIWQRAWCCSGSDDFRGERVLALVVYKYELGEEQSRQTASLCMQQREHAALVPNVLVRMPSPTSRKKRGQVGPQSSSYGLRRTRIHFLTLCLTNVVILLAVKKSGKY